MGPVPLPLQGDRATWRLRQHYVKDAPLFRDPLGDRELEFGPAAAGQRGAEREGARPVCP